MAAKPGVEVKGADLLARSLAKASKDQQKAVAASNRKVARYARDQGRDRARSGTKQQRKMAGGIGSRASKNDARLTIKNTKGAPGAQGAFYGAKGRSGWYANPRYAESTGRQFPQWVGNSWPIATKGQGPQPINDMLADELPKIGDMYLEGAWDALKVPPGLGR